MKKIVFKTMMIIGLSIISIGLSADPPDMPGEHGTNGDVPGGGAPVGSGLAILIAMGSAYGAYRMKIQE